MHGAFWFLLKVGLYLYLFMWLRFTFPRYRFDQLMAFGVAIFDSAFDREFVMGIAWRSCCTGNGWSHWTAFL